MNRHHRWIILSLLLLTQAWSTAHAEKMSRETHTLLIDKLEAVLKSSSARDVSRANVLIRVGDLYSERARLTTLDTSANCQGDCPQIQADRKKALSYYEQALPQAKNEERESITLQMTHLYELTGQPGKASALYKKALTDKRSTTSFLAQVYTGLGEIAYREARAAEAATHFQKALNFKDTPRRGLVTYRLAWSLLNSGDQRKGIETLIRILKDKNLQTRETSEGLQEGPAFVEDVSRDLATFLARGSVGPAQAQLLRDLSPAHVAHENMIYLGTEADRLGNKSGALFVYKLSLDAKPTATQRLDILIRIAQVQLELGHKELAVADLEKAVQFWQKNGCQAPNKDEDPCPEMQKRVREMVTDWDRRSRKKYQSELLQAYALYNSLFTTDTEMHYWAGVVARNLKNSRKAVEYFHKASLLAHDDMLNKREKKNLKNMFEGSLLGEIEMAELSKDAQLREAAYVHYLSLNPRGDRHMEVRFQKAQVAFEKKQFADSAAQFYEVALKLDRKPEEIRVRAADMAIDALVEIKDDEHIESWANEFAKSFPAKRNDFAKVSRTASLKLVAKAVTDQKSSSSDVNDALKRLQVVNLSGASQDDQVSFYKTKLMLAERNQDLGETERAASQLLTVKGLSEADRDYALGQKAWAAESRLDFAQALKISKQMKFKNLSEGERILRLAMLSELAGQNATGYYQEYLKRNGGKKANPVRAKLIRSAKNGWALLAQQHNELKRSPDILAAVVLELYLKTKDRGQAERYASKAVLSQPAGHTLGRLMFINDYAKLASSLERHRLPAQGDTLIQKALMKRLEMIRSAEDLAQYAVQTGDWSLQTLSLSLLARENKRLYGELLQLPAPRKLTTAQRTAYLETLKRQAQPYLDKAGEMQAKAKEFWANSDALEQLLEDTKKARPEARSFAVTELGLLNDVAGPRAQWSLNKALNEILQKRAASDLSRARRQVRENPFNLQAVQNLKDVEQESGGSETMSVYLEARLEQLQSGGRK